MVLPVRRRGTDVFQYIELSEQLAPFLGGVSEQSPPRLFLPSAGAGFFADERDHHFCRSRALVRFGGKRSLVPALFGQEASSRRRTYLRWLKP